MPLSVVIGVNGAACTFAAAHKSIEVIRPKNLRCAISPLSGRPRSADATFVCD
jgi:hypothetical protein